MRTLRLSAVSFTLACLVTVPVFADRAEKIAEVGLTRGGLSEARAHYSGIASPDSRDEFAYGLVLLRHFKRAEAVEHLERCRGDASFLPGWEAALRVLADERKYDVILEDLPSLAAAVSELVDVEQARAFAERLGKLVAAVELASDSPDGEAAWLATLENLRPSLQKAFDVGYEEVAALAKQIESRTKLRNEIATETAREREAAERKRLDVLVEGAKTEKDDLQKNAQDWTDYLTKLQTATGERMAKYATELEAIDKRRAIRVFQLAEIRAAYERVARPAPEAVTVVTNGRNNALAALEAEIAARLLDLEDEELRRSAVVEDAQDVWRNYAAAVGRARSTLGDAANRFASLERDGAAARRRLEKLAQANQAAWRPRFSVRQLFPWNFDEERTRLNN